MEKVFRSWTLRQVERPETGPLPVLLQFTRVDGEFGPISLLISAELGGPEDLLESRFKETSGSDPDTLHRIRNNEMNYFTQFILPLFNPSNPVPDVSPFSFSPAPESPSE